MPESFYDELASCYHLLYGDWERAIAGQGAALDALLRECDVRSGEDVLDAACGIGTQTLGLVQYGYRVTASDISSGAVERLRLELARRGVHADSRVDDIRTLRLAAAGSFSAVLACDNAIAHLLSDDEILEAFRSCFRCLRPGGVAVCSVRDYAAMERRNPDVRPYGLSRDAGRRFLAVQVWEWEGDQYDLRMYLTSESEGGTCETRVLRSRLYAVTIARLVELLREAGFADIQRRDDVLFQPILLGRRTHVP